MNWTQETKNTLKTSVGVIILACATYAVGYNSGRYDEKKIHENDQISISIDYEKGDGEHPEQRVSVFGTLGKEKFGLLDVGNYSTIRNYESHNIPDSVETDTHFKMLDSIVKVELDKEVARWPFNAKMKTTVDTGFDVRLELKPEYKK
jgi:hypothetical protein